MQAVAEYEKSIAKYPNIKPGQEFTGVSVSKTRGSELTIVLVAEPAK